jgi:hypothetical protein
MRLNSTTRHPFLRSPRYDGAGELRPRDGRAVARFEDQHERVALEVKPPDGRPREDRARLIVNVVGAFSVCPRKRGSSLPEARTNRVPVVFQAITRSSPPAVVDSRDEMKAGDLLPPVPAGIFRANSRLAKAGEDLAVHR